MVFRGLVTRTMLRQALTASDPWTPREAPWVRPAP